MADKNKNHEGRATVGFTLGILGIIFAITIFYMGIIISIFGLIQSLKEKNELGKKAKKLNIIGIIIGMLILIANIILMILGISSSNLFPTA